MRVKFSDIEFAYDFVNSSEYGGNAAYFCKVTGESYLVSDDGDLDETPEDIEEEGKYFQIPDKYDLDLGKELVWDFVKSRLPEDYDEVRRMFSRRGAYSRFKDFLFSRDLLDAWHHFELEQTRSKLRAWCQENHIELDESSE